MPCGESLRRLLTHATFALALLTAGPALAGEFTVAVEEVNYLPQYSGLDGNYRGIARTVLDRFAARYGHRFTYVPLPNRRLQHEFYAEGKYDFTFPDNPAWRTAAKAGRTLHYSAPMLYVTEGLLVRPDRITRAPATFRVIGTIRGFTLPAEIARRLQAGTLEVEYADNTASLVRMLDADRVDAVFFAEEVVRHAATGAQLKHGQPVLSPRAAKARVPFMIATQRHTAVLRQFNEFLRTHSAEIEIIKREALTR